MSPLADTTYNCQDVIARMGDYLDRELSDAEVALVKEHLDACGPCEHAFRWEDSILRKVKSCAQEPEMPEGLADQIFQTIELADS